MTDVFDAYAAYYDLLYRDKDYAGEVAYLHELIQRHAPEGRTLLELGCGTGAHAAHFARHGYSVHGLDLSQGMLDRAQTMATALPIEQASRLRFECGDVRNWRSNEEYDVVLSLFHVFSYQLSDVDIQAAFKTASTHLRSGGVLIIDFWYGPAVKSQRPERRIKRLEDQHIRLTRIAEPTSFPEENRVDVNYEVQVDNRLDGKRLRFLETHRMRYFFRPELEILAVEAGLQPLVFHEWLTHKAPSTDSWSAMMIARRTE